MAIQTAFEIGEKLSKALGLPKNVRWLELRVAGNEAVTVRCEYYPERVDGMPLDTVLAEYVVVRREVELAANVHFDAWFNARRNAAHAAFIGRR
jgi:hypothetical protein